MSKKKICFTHVFCLFFMHTPFKQTSEEPTKMLRIIRYDQVRSGIALVHCVNYGQFRRNAFHLLMILIKSGVCRLAREHKAWHFSH